MSRAMLHIVREPRGEVYKTLIDYTLGKFPAFLLVFRPEDLPLSDGGENIKKRLSYFAIKEENSFEWPGTRIFTDKAATVFYFKIEPDSVRILKEAAAGLYDWQQPNLLEDLCVIREDETPWMLSISHESDAYFHVSPEELIQIKENLPGIIISNNKI